MPGETFPLTEEVTAAVWAWQTRPETEATAPVSKGRVVVEACVACAKKLALVDALGELQIEVKGMGVPLTEALKDPETQVLTF